MSTDRGSPSVELLGFLPILVLVALAVWQLLLVGVAGTSAQQAARTGSRAAATQGLAQAEPAARAAVAPWLREGVAIERTGTRITVRVPVPVVVPGATSDRWGVTRSAELPHG